MVNGYRWMLTICTYVCVLEKSRGKIKGKGDHQEECILVMLLLCTHLCFCLTVGTCGSREEGLLLQVACVKKEFNIQVQEC